MFYFLDFFARKLISERLSQKPPEFGNVCLTYVGEWMNVKKYVGEFTNVIQEFRGAR